MLHESFHYIGQDPNERLLIVDDREHEKLARVATDRLKSAIRWRDIEAESARLAYATAIEFRGETPPPDLLRTCCQSFRNAEYLGIPSGFLSSVAIWPNYLKTLQVNGSRGVKVLPTEVWPHVKRLLSWPGVILFDQRSFPKSTDFYTRCDKKGRVLTEISKAPSTEVLTVSDLISLESIPRRDWSDVRFLRIIHCPLFNLQGIHHFPGVTDVFIQDCPKLIDISALNTLRNFRELTIGYCTSLSNVSILSNTHLDKLAVFGCENLQKDHICLTVEALEMSTCIING